MSTNNQQNQALFWLVVWCAILTALATIFSIGVYQNVLIKQHNTNTLEYLTLKSDAEVEAYKNQMLLKLSEILQKEEYITNTPETRVNFTKLQNETANILRLQSELREMAGKVDSHYIPDSVHNYLVKHDL